MTARSVFVAIGLLVLVAGCAAQQGGTAAAPGAPPTVDVTGVWQGYRSYGGGNTLPVTLQLQQTGPKVTGTAHWPAHAGGTSAAGAALEGSVAGDQFSYAIPTTGYKGDTTVKADTMTGSMDGPYPLRLELRRQK